MKGNLKKFFSVYLVFAVGIIGLFLTFWGLWFQTEGFTLEYVMPRQIIIAIAIGLVGSVLVMRYLVQMSIERKAGSKIPKLSYKDLQTMIYGDMIGFFVGMILQYTTGSIAFFLMGSCFMVFCLTSIWFYIIWILIIKKVKEKRAN